MEESQILQKGEDKHIDSKLTTQEGEKIADNKEEKEVLDKDKEQFSTLEAEEERRIKTEEVEEAKAEKKKKREEDKKKKKERVILEKPENLKKSEVITPLESDDGKGSTSIQQERQSEEYPKDKIDIENS